MNHLKRMLCTLLVICLSTMLMAQKDKEQLIKQIEKQGPVYGKIAKQIWGFAELGYQEEKSSKLLRETLKEAGFSLEEGVAEMPTAFVASFGSGKPVIGILGEFDALPGMSQDTVPERKKLDHQIGGHACGHHLFGVASAAAAIQIKSLIERNKLNGTIRFYGTPAEEGGAGKVYMVREGLFDDVDAVLHWHPSSANDASPGTSLANKSAKFRFYGQSSHAAGAPWRGRSALDGVEAMNHMVNMLREHVPPETRIHYVITKGGDAPNIVPEFAEVYYYVRHPETKMVRSIFERVAKAAEGAALGTGTRMEYEVIHGLYNLMPNEALSRIVYDNLQKVGGVVYNDAERAFASKLSASLGDASRPLSRANVVEAFEIKYGRGGSTDVGDISWVVPTAGLGTATWVPGTSAHSWQAVAAGGTSIGIKGMLVAAKTLALSAYDFFKDPALLEEANMELEKRVGAGFKYEALLGDRKPPLDYRN